jgi:hypothetical protein
MNVLLNPEVKKNVNCFNYIILYKESKGMYQVGQLASTYLYE